MFLSTAFAATNDLKEIISTPAQALGKLGTVTNWIFATLITVAVIFILIAAWEYLTSKGGEGVSTAHKMLLYAAVAIMVGVLAKGIVTVVAKIAGQSDVKFENPN